MNITFSKAIYFLGFAAFVASGYKGGGSHTVYVPTEAEIEAAIAASDDFSIHKSVFLKATSSLVGQGRCPLSELKEMGGWVKSQNHKSQPVYFTYCGGMRVDKRIYVDVSTGSVVSDCRLVRF